MIKLYSKKGCAECVLLKRKFENKGVEFKEVDVDTLEPKEIARVIQGSGRKKMPVVEKDGKFLPDNEINTL
jgi:glutaredoxin